MVKLAKALVRLVISLTAIVVTLYFVIALCVAFFKITGTLATGAPMYLDLRTPSWPPLLVFIVGSAVFLIACVYAHKKLR